MREKKALVKATASRYRRSTKKAKKKVLDEFVESTGYNRSYASLILSKYGKEIWTGELRVVGGTAIVRHRRRERIYDEKTLAALRKIWVIMDWICGKRLAAAIPMVVPVLEREQGNQTGPTDQRETAQD